MPPGYSEHVRCNHINPEWSLDFVMIMSIQYLQNMELETSLFGSFLFSGAWVIIVKNFLFFIICTALHGKNPTIRGRQIQRLLIGVLCFQLERLSGSSDFHAIVDLRCGFVLSSPYFQSSWITLKIR